jgi:hypothetical protein
MPSGSRNQLTELPQRSSRRFTIFGFTSFRMKQQLSRNVLEIVR